MRNTEHRAGLACKANGFGRTARALGTSRPGVVPQPHGHPHHLKALVNEQHGRHGAVHPTAHGNRDTLLTQRLTPMGV